MKIIQICGSNGTGKTTLVKNLIRGGKFLKMNVVIDGKNREWWYDGRIAVIGKYNSANCCGCDAGNYTGETLINVISALILAYRPNVILFEDVRFGGSYTFKTRAMRIAKENGYEYCSFVLMARFETLCKRVLGRTGNENVNFDQIRSKARQVISSSRKIHDDGASVVWVDTEKYSTEDILSCLRGVING